MPHIKSYLRYRGDDVAWLYVGSHNLSKAGVPCCPCVEPVPGDAATDPDSCTHQLTPHQLTVLPYLHPSSRLYVVVLAPSYVVHLTCSLGPAAEAGQPADGAVV